MPDYASILRRSIAALPDPSPPMREAVYQRARAALARQLTAVDPPLSTREIETQHQELEDAVARLEADFAPDEPEDESRPTEDYYSPPPVATALRPDPAAAGADRRGGNAAFEAPQAEDEEEEDEDDFEAEGETRSRLPLLVALLAVILVVIGIGAYAFSQQERIAALFGGGAGEEAVAVAEPPEVPVVTAPAEEPGLTAEPSPGKSTDRLTNGETPVGETQPPADTLPEPALGEPGEETTAALPPEEPGEQDVQGLVAQRAIFYLQGKGGSPSRALEGSVTWAEITRDNAPAIQATLRVNDLDATATVTIYRNNDATLPASHLVEVQFSGKLGASPVQRVPALVLKETEQAKGQPLAGAAVPVTDELFWIALSSDEEQIARNVQLLREGSWFDIPITFTDETRALLTFEKGIPGDKVFETVMASWAPG